MPWPQLVALAPAIEGAAAILAPIAGCGHDTGLGLHAELVPGVVAGVTRQPGADFSQAQSATVKLIGKGSRPRAGGSGQRLGFSSAAIASTRSTMRRRTLESLTFMNALVNASPSEVARKSET